MNFRIINGLVITIRIRIKKFNVSIMWQFLNIIQRFEGQFKNIYTIYGYIIHLNIS